MASSINNKNVAMIFNGLVEYNPETEDQTDLRCDLCTSWELAEDGVTYTFHLHPDATFSDGHPGHRRGRGLQLPWPPPAPSAYPSETARPSRRPSR